MHLNKPDTLNSLTTVMAGDFEAALQQLQEDTAARVLIITGNAPVGVAQHTAGNSTSCGTVHHTCLPTAACL